MPINTDALNNFSAKFYNNSTELTNEDLRADIAQDGATATFDDTGTGKVSRWGRRVFVPSDAENLHLKEVSRQFFQSVKDIFGGETEIPKSILDAMGVHDRADGKMRPLTLRRIRIVHDALENLAEVKDIRAQQARAQAQDPIPVPEQTQAQESQPELTDEEKIQAAIDKNFDDFKDYDPEAENRDITAAARDFQACLLNRLNVNSEDVEAFLAGTKTINNIDFAEIVTRYVDKENGLHALFDKRYQTLSSRLEGTAKKAFELWYKETCGCEHNPYARTAKNLGLSFAEPESAFDPLDQGNLAKNIREENAHQWLNQQLNVPCQEMNEVFNKLENYQTSKAYQSLQATVAKAANDVLAKFGTVTEAERTAVLQAATAKLEERLANDPAELLDILQGVDRTDQIGSVITATAKKTLCDIRTAAIERQVRTEAQQALAQMANSLRKSVVFNTLRENRWSTTPTLSDADFDKILNKLPGFTLKDFEAAMNKHLDSCVEDHMRDQADAIENYRRTGSFAGSTSLSERLSGRVYNEELTIFMEFSRGICKVEPYVDVPFIGQIIANTVAIMNARGKAFDTQHLPTLQAFTNTVCANTAISEILTEKDGGSTKLTRLVWLTGDQCHKIAQSNANAMIEQFKSAARAEYRNRGEIGPVCEELKVRYVKLAASLNELLMPKFDALYKRLTNENEAFAASGVKKLVVKSADSRAKLGDKLGKALAGIYAELFAHPSEYMENADMLAYSKIYSLCRTAINEFAADDFVRTHLNNQGLKAGTEPLERLLKVFP